MKKLFKIVIVFLLLGGGVYYGLTPSQNVKSADSLAKVNGTVDVNSFNSELIQNVEYSNSKLTSSINVDNDTFNKLLKNSLTNEKELLKGSYKLDGSKLNIKLPINLKIIDSQIEATASVSGSNNALVINVENAKLGKIPVPSFVVENYLKNNIGTNSDIKVDGTKVTISLANDNANIDSISIKNSEINITFSLTTRQLTRLGGNILNNYLNG